MFGPCFLIWFLVSDLSGFLDEEERTGGFALVVFLLLLSTVGRSVFEFFPCGALGWSVNSNCDIS